MRVVLFSLGLLALATVAHSKGSSILQQLTGRINAPTLVPAPLRHVLSLFGLRGRKLPAIPLSPFAAATNVRPVYAPPVMLPIPANPPQNQPPPPPPTHLQPNPYDMSQVLPPYLGDPSEEPRLQFVPLPKHHQHMQPPNHQPHPEAAAPVVEDKQQVMYIYVDEEGKTVATKVTDPSEGPETALPVGYNIRPTVKIVNEEQPQVEVAEQPQVQPMMEMTSDGMDVGPDPNTRPQETLYMLSDFKQYVKPSRLPPTPVSNGGWIPVSPSTSYVESTDGNTNSNNNNNNGPASNPASESIDTETETEPPRESASSSAVEESGKSEEYPSDDGTSSVPGDSSSSGASLPETAFSDQSSNSGSTSGTSVLSSSSLTHSTSGKSVTGVTESGNRPVPSSSSSSVASASAAITGDESSHSPASKPTVSYFEESDKLKPEVHFHHESERVSESTSVTSLTDPSESAHHQNHQSSSSSASSSDSTGFGNRSRFSVAAVFDSDFKPLYTAKNSGDLQFGQRLTSSSSPSSSSRVPRSVKPQLSPRQYLVPIPGDRGIKAYVVINA